jgi:hypothetical protein
VVEREAVHDRIVVSGKLKSEAWGDVHRLVGPESGHHDALVRASLARQVVGAYVTTILAGPGGRISRRAAVLGRCLGWPRSGMGYLCGPLSAALLRPEGGRVAGYDVMSRAGFE